MFKAIQFPEINFSSYKAAFIDLDDTLYDYNTCHKIALERCYAEFIKHVQISYHEFEDLYKTARENTRERLYPQGCCRSRLFAFQEISEKSNLKNNYVVASYFDDLYWQTMLDTMQIDINAQKFLINCQKYNLKTCIVSDMIASVQIKKIIALKITEYIDFLVTSEEAGYEKPHKQIYQLALKKVDAKKDECFMIGDSLEKDIKGAENFGINAYKVD